MIQSLFQCDHISGACQCGAGWQGALCEEPCPPGSHGYNCTKSCQCQHGGKCHPVTGSCSCTPGWEGAVCANPCPAGTFGDNCREKCECYNSASCHHQTGRCECPPGYRGELVRNERPLVTCIFIPSSPSSSLSKDYLCWIRT